MDVFFTDLDNTIIFSHRHTFTEPKILAEMLKGREQSYMTEKTYCFLEESKWLNVVPVTTRTKAQFDRLEMFGDFTTYPYALICNGGVLLEKGQVNQEWLRETKAIAGSELEEVNKALVCLRGLENPEHVYDPEHLYAYGSCENPEVVYGRLAEAVDLEKVHLHRYKKKVFCVPRSVNKGAAVERFKKKYGINRSIAAGDSEFDLSMLDVADIAMVPHDMENCVNNKNKVILNHIPVMSDEICFHLDELHQKGFFYD